MNQSKFKEVMAMLGESYSKQITPALAKLYWSALQDLTDDEFFSAVMLHLNDSEQCQYWPQPGTLRSRIEGTAKQKSISVETQALSAWELVYKSVQRGTPYDSLQLEDKLALAAIKAMGGWTHLCRMREDEAQWKKKEFISNYTTLHGSENLPERLAGIGQKQQDKLDAQKALGEIHERLGEQS